MNFNSGQMEKSELKQEIDILIESIKKQADRMNTQNNLSMVELEVLHHKIQKLYEKSILIHHLPSESLRVTTEAATSPVPLSAVTEVPQRQAAVPPPESKKEEPESVKPQPLKENGHAPKPTLEVIIAGDNKSTQDLFGEALKTEVKAGTKAKTDKDAKPNGVMRKPITDLQKAISINDKFRFINELFEGNSTEFNIALNQINGCPEFDDADRYVSNLRRIYHWKDDSETVSLILDLVERRFL
jgi:hypothetical protein